MPDVFIDKPEDLQKLCATLRGRPWLAVDTEFMRERTYYAQLCLIQIATPDGIACIDPLGMDDLDPLNEIIYDTRVLKVFHAARQDLEVFFNLRGEVPSPVFDTQIAAALLGYDNQISYAALVEDICGARLAKSHTRTNWARRPLSPAQLRYAEDDVRYLHDLYPRLAQRLESAGRSSWLREECARLTQDGLYRNDPPEAYRRFKQFRSQTPAASNILRELAGWREHTAQQQNLPRTWILRDAVLASLAAHPPDRLDEMAGIKGMKESDIKRWGREIMHVIAGGKASPAAATPARPARLDREQTRLRDRMLALVKRQSKMLQIDQTMLATRKDIEALLSGDREAPPLRGWRRDVIGLELLELAAGMKERPAEPEIR